MTRRGVYVNRRVEGQVSAMLFLVIYGAHVALYKSESAANRFADAVGGVVVPIEAADEYGTVVD